MEHTCSQDKRFNSIENKIDAHILAQNSHEKELSIFMEKTSDVMKIVNEKLLPAYTKEQRAENAKEWIKEQAKSGKFWMGVLISIIAFVSLIITVIKQGLK